MAIPLVDIIERLTLDVPPANGVPTEMQYRAAVESAVNDLSERAGVVKTVDVSIVAGTGSYSLPADFIHLIKFTSVFDRTILVAPGQKIIPMGSNFRGETIVASGGTLVISPTPNYTVVRTLVYKAGYILDVNEDYQDLTRHLALIIAPKAAANLLRQIATAGSPAAFRFSFGDLTVDKSNATKALSGAASQLEAEYASLVDKHNGPIGLRATYSSGEVATFFQNQGM